MTVSPPEVGLGFFLNKFFLGNFSPNLSEKDFLAKILKVRQKISENLTGEKFGEKKREEKNWHEKVPPLNIT